MARPLLLLVLVRDHLRVASPTRHHLRLAARARRLLAAVRVWIHLRRGCFVAATAAAGHPHDVLRRVERVLAELTDAMLVLGETFDAFLEGALRVAAADIV